MGRYWDTAVAFFATLAKRYGLNLAAALVIAVVGWLAARWAARAIDALGETSTRVDRTLARVSAKVVRFAILAATAVAVLDKFGVDTASVLALLGAAGLAVGLALKDTVSDVASGIVLLVLRPFVVGEVVDIDGTQGTVEDVGIFQTELTSLEGVPVMLPNSKIRTSKIQNFSRAGKRRVEVLVAIAYSEDAGRAVAVLRDVVAKEPRVLADPEPVVNVNDLAATGVNLLVRVWTKPDDHAALKMDLAREVKARFDAEAIDFPVARRDTGVVPSGRAA